MSTKRERGGPRPIGEVASAVGLSDEEIIPYGRDKAKVHLSALESRREQPDGKLVVVSSITPSPPGEGKTTVTIGLGQGLSRLGKRAIITIREPSIGPCLGIKGGGTGGGRSQVIPADEINLHFTGDLHAVTAAHNLLAATIDNHLFHGNALGIDPRQILWRRVMDINDRALREIVLGLGGRSQGYPREEGFLITAASEVMAILCLALNLVQSLEGTPALVHGGPFANIAHGCNSLVATRLALKLGELCVTEAGFGFDLGAEKFFDIKCPYGELHPDAVVLVVTARALKYHGGAPLAAIDREDLGALARGMENLEKHVEAIRMFKVPLIVAVNRFGADTARELDFIRKHCEGLGVAAAVSDGYARGGEGVTELAQGLLELLEREPTGFTPLYDWGLPVREKIGLIARKMYGALGVVYTKRAERQIDQAEALGYGGLPVCMAKTQRSLSDDPELLGRPRDFRVTVSEVRISAGAGFLVPITGEIMTMPGLPKVPNAERIDVDAEGRIVGLI